MTIAKSEIITIEGLKPWSTYHFTIAAYNQFQCCQKLLSKAKEISVTTTAESEYDIAFSCREMCMRIIVYDFSTLHSIVGSGPWFFSFKSRSCTYYSIVPELPNVLTFDSSGLMMLIS